MPQEQTPHCVIIGPAIFTLVHLLYKCALAEHIVELTGRTGKGHSAFIAALTVGGDRSRNSHISILAIVCIGTHDGQLKCCLAGNCFTAQFNRGGERHAQGDELIPHRVQGNICIRGIDAAQSIFCVVFINPACLDIAITVEGFSGKSQIHAADFDIRQKGKSTAAVILHGVPIYRTATADAVDEDVVRRDLNGLGSDHGFLIRRPSMCRQFKSVCLQVIPFRGHHAVSHTIFIQRQSTASALASGIKSEPTGEGYAVRCSDGEFVLLLRADHIRSADGNAGVALCKGRGRE